MRKVYSLILFIALTLTSCQESFDERCQKEIRQESANNCPKKLSEEVTLDSMNYDIPSRTINYYYTLFNKMDNTQLIEENKDYYRASVLKELVNSIEMKTSKDKKLNFNYIYRSSTTKNLLLQFKLTAKDYNK